MWHGRSARGSEGVAGAGNPCERQAWRTDTHAAHSALPFLGGRGRTTEWPHDCGLNRRLKGPTSSDGTNAQSWPLTLSRRSGNDWGSDRSAAPGHGAALRHC
ncbi:hypothetical protein D3C77_607890 [compost metagenome]